MIRMDSNGRATILLFPHLLKGEMGEIRGRLGGGWRRGGGHLLHHHHNCLAQAVCSTDDASYRDDGIKPPGTFRPESLRVTCGPKKINRPVQSTTTGIRILQPKK